MMTMKSKRAIARLSIVVFAYLIAGPVWFKTTIHDDGSVIEYKRIGVFKWMERERYSWPQHPTIVKHGAFIRTPGVIASVACFAVLIGLACSLEKKWKGQRTGGVDPRPSGRTPQRWQTR